VFSRTIWYLGALLQAFILFRAFRSRILLKYPYFNAYVASGLLTTVLLYVYFFWWTRARNPGAYEKAYWIVQFCTLMIGCGIVLEIFRHILGPYPGADKFATVVAFGTFAAIFCFALAYQLLAPDWSMSKGTAFEIERDVRTVQAIFLFLIFAVIAYYRVPIGKNLRGMIAGYGLYIVTSLFTLATRAYAGPRFNRAWDVIQPCSFDVSLTIWLVALWSYQPSPAPDPSVPLEQDYEALAARTRRALVSMRSHLTKTARP
jgi:hypothetical protein